AAPTPLPSLRPQVSPRADGRRRCSAWNATAPTPTGSFSMSPSAWWIGCPLGRGQRASRGGRPAVGEAAGSGDPRRARGTLARGEGWGWRGGGLTFCVSQVHGAETLRAKSKSATGGGLTRKVADLPSGAGGLLAK